MSSMYNQPVDIPFAHYGVIVQRRIEQQYHLRVVTRDIPDPLTGDLDGVEIHIDYAVTPEQRLFLLAHLFGHTVQWNVAPGAFEIGKVHEPPVDEGLLPDIMDYEREAASYGLEMLPRIGIGDVDQWMSDTTACD